MKKYEKLNSIFWFSLNAFVSSEFDIVENYFSFVIVIKMKGGEFSSFPFNEMTASYYIMLLCRKTHVFDKKEKLMLEINLDCM